MNNSQDNIKQQGFKQKVQDKISNVFSFFKTNFNPNNFNNKNENQEQHLGNNNENDIPNHDSENSSQQDPEENNGSAENLQSNQNGFATNDIVQGFMQKVIDAYDKNKDDFSKFSEELKKLFGESYKDDNEAIIEAGFKAIKSTCGDKFDVKKMENLEDTSDAWNAFKALIALIYNYTLGLVAGQTRTARQDKNDYNKMKCWTECCEISQQQNENGKSSESSQRV